MKVNIGGYPKKEGKQRKIQVRIDPSDVWNMDGTLAHIIAPMLKKLKEQKHGSPYTEDSDVPIWLHSTIYPAENSYETDGNHHLRWDWIMDEMIWAFEQATIDWESQFWKESPELDMSQEEPDENGLFPVIFKSLGVHDSVGHEKHQKRMQNGFRLFGVYYSNLWD